MVFDGSPISLSGEIEFQLEGNAQQIFEEDEQGQHRKHLGRRRISQIVKRLAMKNDKGKTECSKDICKSKREISWS